MVLEFPPEVETSSVASIQLDHVEASQSLSRNLVVEGLRFSACRLSDDSEHQSVSCMNSFAHWQLEVQNLLAGNFGSIDLHWTSRDEVRQSIP